MRKTIRNISRASEYKRDFKRESRGPHGTTLQTMLSNVLTALAFDLPLDKRLADHPLGGTWAGWRECHIKPDLLLIYRKIDDELRLARLGSHSELFG